MSPIVNRSNTACAAMELSCLVLLGLFLLQVSHVHAEQDAGNIAKPSQEIISFVDLNGDGIDDRSEIVAAPGMASPEGAAPMMIDPQSFQLQGVYESTRTKSARFRQSLFLSASLVQYRGGMGALLDQQYSSGTGIGNASLSNCVGGICFPQ